jgi:hypothetical protein
MSDLFDWRTHLPVHPAADLFPLLSESELKELAEDIRKNGLRTRIVIYSEPRVADDGSVRAGDHIEYLLDGRNRLDALASLGFLCLRNFKGLNRVPFSLRKTWNGEEWEDTKSEFDYDDVDNDVDPYAIALSLNVHRRHLTAEQKRELIAELLKAKPEQSNRSVAKQVKADDKTVASVRRDMEATAEIPQLEKTVGADGKARKHPAKKPAKVNRQAVSTDGKQIEDVIAKLPTSWESPDDIAEQIRAEEGAEAITVDAKPEAPAAPVDFRIDIEWPDDAAAPPQIETPRVSYLDKPWLAAAAEMESAIEAKCDAKNAPLVELDKQLQSIVTTLDVAERAAANLIFHMVDQRKQTVRSIAKLLGKDPKWVKDKFDLAKPVTEAAA